MARVVYVTGCRWEFLAWLENNFDVVGATALAFAILHVRSVHLLYIPVHVVVGLYNL